jgi:hypothetical protein
MRWTRNATVASLWRGDSRAPASQSIADTMRHAGRLGWNTLRILAPVASLIWVGVAGLLFAYRIGPYSDDTGCMTAGAPGTTWAIAELGVALIGLAAAVVFAIAGRPGSDRGKAAVSFLVIALATWVALAFIVPSVHSCQRGA